MIEWTDPAIEGDAVLCDCGRNPVVVVGVSTSDVTGSGIGLTAAGCIDHVDAVFAKVRAWIDADAVEWWRER